MEGVANALRQTGEQLHEQDQGSVGRYAEQAAEQAERFSGYLRDRDANQLLNDVEDFARERPAIFLGGAFLLGAAAARFLKSSAGRREEFDVRENARELGSSATGKDLNDESGGGSYRDRDRDRDTGEDRASYFDDEERYETTSIETSFDDEDTTLTRVDEAEEEEQPTPRTRRRRRNRRGSSDAAE